MKSPLLAALVCGVSTIAAPALAQTGVPSVPIEVWALRDAIATADISPDGKHLMVLRMPSKDGEYVMEIFKTSDLSKPWRRLNADPMEIISAQFVSDDYIYGTAWQVVRNRVTRPEEDVRGYRSFGYSLKSNKFSGADGNFNIVGLLPKEPNTVLVETSTPNDGGTGVDPFEAFRPRSYYRFNLDTAARELVLRGSSEHPTATFDIDGNPRFTAGVKPGSNELVYYYRMPGDGSWKEFGERYDLDEHENLYRVLGGFQGLKGFDPNNPSIGYVVDARNDDKAALWEFDFSTGQFGRKLYSNPDADVMAIKTNSMYWAGDNSLAAAVYPGEKMERHWFDPEEQQLYELFEKSIPDAHQINVRSRSRDGKTMLVTNVGPRDPGSYWLFMDGRIVKIGSENPLLKPEQLADVEFIRYPARDGKTIPAYITKPKGEGPFPLVVIPHGGPHVNEVIAYDEWGQLLANAGYMVLQPQYRMSVGWGKDHFDAGYGEHGLAMQDDKDDGVKYLVAQGLVDPNRVAMFGWSYGGYAALVASQREDNLYQCAIAGAAVADPAKSYRDRRSPNSPKALDEWAQRRGMIGVNPIAQVEKTNIPLMMVHGDVDHRVEYWHLKDFRTAMERAGKYNPRVTVGEEPSSGGEYVEGETQTSGDVVATRQQANYQPRNRFVTLEGAGHFYSTLMYDHQEKLYKEMLDFLRNDCGPGGL